MDYPSQAVYMNELAKHLSTAKKNQLSASRGRGE